MTGYQEIPVDSVVFRKDLYPRFTPDAATIQRYQEALDVLPPIEVNQHSELIDGYHRWNAYREAGSQAIPATVTVTESDDQLLDFAIDRNAKHGIQLTADDKRRLAIRLYQGRQRTETDLTTLLSVSLKTIQRWLADTKRSEREQQRTDAFELWLACYTQEAIAARVGVARNSLVEWFEELSDLTKWPNPTKLSSLYQDADWKPPLYNVWTWGKDDATAVDHFGNSHSGIVDRLIYLFTIPFEIVVDPFAGGGSTADVCRKRMRRYWLSDRKVKSGLEDEKHVRTADIADGPPRLPWADVSLVYLDPPYWKQAEGQYSDDPTDLANMTLEDFYASLTGYVKATAHKMQPGAHIAILIQPTQWNSGPQHDVVDHVVDLCRQLESRKLSLKQRISCPYSTQQANAQMVTWAKEHKQLLGLTRECIVFEVV